MELINDFKLKAENLSETGYRVRIEYYFTRGLEIFRMKMDFFLIYTIIYLASMFIPFAGFIISIPLLAGFFISAHHLVKGKKLYFEDMFDGFKHFVGLLLFALISSIIIFFGFLALIIPGIYLLVGYLFAPLFIVFGKMEFWDAMETSRRLIHKEWFSIFLFLILLGIFNLLGVLALGIGVLFTIPITYCAIYAAFEDIVGVN